MKFAIMCWLVKWLGNLRGDAVLWRYADELDMLRKKRDKSPEDLRRAADLADEIQRRLK